MFIYFNPPTTVADSTKVQVLEKGMRYRPTNMVPKRPQNSPIFKHHIARNNGILPFWDL
jgi:hypothetical protein